MTRRYKLCANPSYCKTQGLLVDYRADKVGTLKKTLSCVCYAQALFHQPTLTAFSPGFISAPASTPTSAPVTTPHSDPGPNPTSDTF